MGEPARYTGPYEFRFESQDELEQAFGTVISYEFLGHCEVDRGRRVLRFSTLPGHEASLLKRVERASLPPQLSVPPRRR